MKIIVLTIALSIPFFILTVWAVVNAALKDFGSPAKKALWLVVASIPYVGFIFYFTIGSRKGKKSADISSLF